MKLKDFTVVWSYTSPSGDNKRYTPVQPSNIKNLVKRLRSAIDQADHNKITSILREEFIYPSELPVKKEVTKRYDYAKQADIFDTRIYARHLVGPVLEVLFVAHHNDYCELYNLTRDNPLCREALSNFTNLNLKNADLSVLDFDRACFSGTDLSHAKNVTQATLENSCYDFAKLPNGLVQPWSRHIERNVHAALNRLNKYGEMLQKSKDAEGREKGVLLCNHIADLKHLVASSAAHNLQFRETFIRQLHSHDQQFDKPRYFNLKMIFANAALCVLGLGVFYAAALGVHYLRTERCWFFERTKSRELIDAVQDTLHHADW